MKQFNEEISKLMTSEILIFPQEFENFQKFTKAHDFNILELKELELIDSISCLIELKNENKFLLKKVNSLERILSKNLFEKKIQKNNLEINLWALTEKDKKIKEKINIWNQENKKAHMNRKKKKFLVEKIENEEEFEEKSHKISNKKIENSYNSNLNKNIVESKIKKGAKNNIKNNDSILENFSENSSNENFSFDRVNKFNTDNKNNFNFLTNNFVFEPTDKKSKINLKKEKKIKTLK